jgi:hypothetical protein
MDRLLEDSALAGYVPPKVRALGNVHDLLAMGKSGNSDCMGPDPGITVGGCGGD